jgi:8-oxo-dGTP pyrophosphatase MutT (NUDIX family)
VITRSAGLAIFKERRLLLVHPKGGSMSNFSIPKGIIEPNESILDAAIRETREEVGLEVSLENIDTNNEHKVLYLKNNQIVKIVYYYTAVVDINFTGHSLPKENLQLNEINYAAFFTREEAKSILFWRLEPLLYLDQWFH